MSRLGAALVAAALFPACTFYNTIYNTERLYEAAEQDRRAGRDSLARVRYGEVISRTADAYRGRPTDERAARTLLLLGRAQVRVGDAAAARLTLEEAALRAEEPGLRAKALVYLALALARLGEEREALHRLEEALSASPTPEALAEAHLLRGSLLLERRSTDDGWSDLAVAGADPGIGVDAGVEQLKLAVRHAEWERALDAAAGLLGDRAAGERFDTIAILVRAAVDRWGAARVAGLLAASARSRWEQTPRGRVLLLRAKLLHEAADTTAALDEAWAVASGRGPAATEARLLIAGWRLRTTLDIGAADAVRSILLPVGDDPDADAMVGALDDLDRYSALGLDEPLGWFAAAEVARDRLAAPGLARGLFLAYADTDPSDPWAPKALLAALDVAQDEEDRSWLRGRLEEHVASPYVRAAQGTPLAGFEVLEEELSVRLSEITGR
ncbi:MAG TPA: hypothetical protein VLA09_14325 [Longimicrobiales bacterium]|nr:hypothetical protein [Longimicrobiales bacterium]